MKKLLCCIFIVLLLIVSGCSKEEEKPNWKDYFQVTYEYKSELDETYTIKNKTNEVLENVILIFEIDPNITGDNTVIKYEWEIFDFKQGESKVEEFGNWFWKAILKRNNLSTDITYTVDLVDITFDIKE